VGDPLTDPPITAVAEAIERRTAIAGALPADDGLASFNRMYLAVTIDVNAAIRQGFYADPHFMTELDVVFVNLYLDAVRASVSYPDRVAKAWAALLESRSRPGIEPIQFALAGMNAHINHDLPLAVVRTCRELDTSPGIGWHHADYRRIDSLLDGAEQRVRQSFEGGWALDVDRHLQAVITLVGNWSITRARSTAWTNALTLWALRHVPLIARDFAAGLDHMVGFAGRGLLLPV
jgi:hypothetical protein